MKIRAFEERAVMQKVVLSCDLEISPKQPGQLGLLGILKRQGKIVMVFTCTSGRVERLREGRGEA